MSSAPPEVVAFGRFPSPVTGESLANEEFVAIARREARVQIVRSTRPRPSTRGSGRMTPASIAEGLRSVRDLRATLRRVRPDVAYFVPVPTVGGHVRDLPALRAMRRHATRVVAHVHSGNFAARAYRFRHLPSVRYLLSRVDRFLFLSESLAAPLLGHLGQERVFIVPNPIDAAVEFEPEEVQARLDRATPDAPVRLLYLSNFYRSKGYGALLDALETIGTSAPWRASFAGGWPNSEAHHQAGFLDRIARSPVRDRVEMLGPVSDRAQVRSLLERHDVLLLPTSYPLEAQPKAIIEAMNAGLAIVATARGGIPDMLAHGRGGILLPPGDPEALVRAVRRVLVVDERIGLGRAARAVFDQRFSRRSIETVFLEALLGE